MKEVKILLSDEVFAEIEKDVKQAKIVTPDVTVEQYIQELVELHLKTKKEVESFNSGMGDILNKMGNDMNVQDMLSKFMQSMSPEMNTPSNTEPKEKGPKNSDDVDPRTKYRS